VAYRADIEIGVKGQEAIGRLQKQLDGTLNKINQLNKTSVFRTGNVTQNIDRYVRQLDLANKAISLAAAGTDQETRAYNNKAKALGNLNAVQARSNYLLEQAIANQRKVQVTANAGFGQQGPALPPRANARAGGGIGKGIGGAVSNAAIGGAFPLLFGQSGAAAAGGALGGIAGSVLGPSGGFAGSLVGTILGEKLGQGNQVKQLGEDIGFSAEQTKMLGIAFQQAGRDFDKFQQSVSTIQGLSLSIEDQARAIQLASSLTETYKGKIDKVTNAFASALSTGKVTQGTLNQLTSQGIPIQQALADKYNVSRSAIIEMAKDGKISVQDLIDTLVKVGNEGAKAADKQKDVFADSFEQISQAVADFQTTASQAFKETADALRVDLGGAIQAATTYITDLIGGFAELARVAGPVLDPIISGYINLEKAIFNAVGAVPALRDAIVNFALTALGPLAGVVTLINQIRGLGAVAKGPEKQGPYVPDRLKQKPLQSFIAPAQMEATGKKDNSAEKAAKAAEREAERVANIVRDRAAATEQLRLQAQYGQALFTAEVAKDSVLKIQLEREQKISEISIQYSKDINDERAKGNSAAVKEAFTKQALVKVQVQELLTTQELKRLEIERAENYATLLEDLQYELDLKSAVTEEQRRQLELAYEMAKLQKNPDLTDAQREEIKRRKEQIAAPKTSQENIEERVGTLKDELAQLTSLSNLAITGAEAIGTAFSTSFKGIIDGSMTAREALSSFFKSVADAFLDMAAQIIAKWITMTILNSVLSLFPGGGGGGSGNSFNANGALPAGTGNIPSISSTFAEGGFVTGPTNAIIGEGGQPEYVIPASKMRESMSRYAAGARGAAVIGSGNGGGDMGGGTATMASSAIDVRYSVERINSVDYVTADQFQQGMRQAALQGATQGEQRTLRRLQQSPSTRRRVGM
jgi:tape measure domain-containing protein